MNKRLNGRIAVVMRLIRGTGLKEWATEGQEEGLLTLWLEVVVVVKELKKERKGTEEEEGRVFFQSWCVTEI